jgi:hypothetical protein
MAVPGCLGCISVPVCSDHEQSYYNEDDSVFIFNQMTHFSSNCKLSEGMGREQEMLEV